MEEQIVQLLEQRGPLTGSEIWEAVSGDGLTLWRTCRLSEKLDIRVVGTRYMRLDRNVEGYARLSPSILREFLTYSVIGLKGESLPITKRAKALISHMEKVNKAKLDLVYQIASSLVTRCESEWAVDDMICFIIAGDIVYNMAHDAPRPERSTKKMVKGSDMDVVVILDNKCPDDLMKYLDDSIYREKYSLLMAPHIKEEIDYIVKKMATVQQQVQFDTFRRMVACKILHEGTFLCGSERLFTNVKTLLRASGVTEKINELGKQANGFRRQAESCLLAGDSKTSQEKSLLFFYPTEESEEFE